MNNQAYFSFKQRTKTMNPKVDFYFTKEKKWHDEIKQLRAIVLDCNLTEDLKWGVPCYNLNERNIVLIHVFKEYCALLFFKGTLLNNDHGLLIQQTKNVQAARQIRFINLKEILDQTSLIKATIFEAIEAEKAGLKVPLKKTSEYEMVEEFEQQLNENAFLKTAFEALSPGRQRAYHLFFSSAKLAKTREARIAKCIPQILAGKGLND
jgi:uncharacterized protein YdeI (YjbR/CyaY-like superfamily)